MERRRTVCKLEEKLLPLAYRKKRNKAAIARIRRNRNMDSSLSKGTGNNVLPSGGEEGGGSNCKEDTILEAENSFREQASLSLYDRTEERKEIGSVLESPEINACKKKNSSKSGKLGNLDPAGEPYKEVEMILNEGTKEISSGKTAQEESDINGSQTNKIRKGNLSNLFHLDKTGEPYSQKANREVNMMRNEGTKEILSEKTPQEQANINAKENINCCNGTMPNLNNFDKKGEPNTQSKLMAKEEIILEKTLEEESETQIENAQISQSYEYQEHLKLTDPTFHQNVDFAGDYKTKITKRGRVYIHVKPWTTSQRTEQSVHRRKALTTNVLCFEENTVSSIIYKRKKKQEDYRSLKERKTAEVVLWQLSMQDFKSHDDAVLLKLTLLLESIRNSKVPGIVLRRLVPDVSNYLGCDNCRELTANILEEFARKTSVSNVSSLMLSREALSADSESETIVLKLNWIRHSLGTLVEVGDVDSLFQLAAKAQTHRRQGVQLAGLALEGALKSYLRQKTAENSYKTFEQNMPILRNPMAYTKPTYKRSLIRRKHNRRVRIFNKENSDFDQIKGKSHCSCLMKPFEEVFKLINTSLIALGKGIMAAITKTDPSNHSWMETVEI